LDDRKVMLGVEVTASMCHPFTSPMRLYGERPQVL